MKLIWFFCMLSIRYTYTLSTYNYSTNFSINTVLIYCGTYRILLKILILSCFWHIITFNKSCCIYTQVWNSFLGQNTTLFAAHSYFKRTYGVLNIFSLLVHLHLEKNKIKKGIISIRRRDENTNTQNKSGYIHLELGAKF